MPIKSQNVCSCDFLLFMLYETATYGGIYMSQIKINNLSFYYDGSYDTIFQDVSLVLDTDWKLGLLGRNGRGKTTFLKLLMKEYEYIGSITSSVDFDYFPYPIKDSSLNTIDVIENIYPAYELWKVCKELSLLYVDAEVLYRPFDTLSNGEQTKVLLSLLFTKENNFLLIDEPTNHLDQNSREILMNYLNSKKGYILVSHDRYFLDGTIDHVLSINKNNIDLVQGNFTSWWENKKMQDEFELNENEKLKKDIKRLSVSAERTKNWSDKIEDSKIGSHSADRGFIGHKAAKMMKRSISIQNRIQSAIDEKEKLLKNIENAETLKLFPLTHYKDNIISIQNLSIEYDSKKVICDLNFSIKNGQRIVLKGKNGSGKSSIIKAILDEISNYEGTINKASGLEISYVSQDTSYLNGKLSEYASKNGLNETLFKALLRKLDFSRVQFEKNIEDFSGGQKKKVLLAKSLCEQAHLYIWDEPLNFIDVYSRMQVEELILLHSPTMLFVEHDKYFTEKIATDIIDLD